MAETERGFEPWQNLAWGCAHRVFVGHHVDDHDARALDQLHHLRRDKTHEPRSEKEHNPPRVQVRTKGTVKAAAGMSHARPQARDVSVSQGKRRHTAQDASAKERGGGRKEARQCEPPTGTPAGCRNGTPLQHKHSYAQRSARAARKHVREQPPGKESVTRKRHASPNTEPSVGNRGGHTRCPNRQRRDHRLQIK